MFIQNLTLPETNNSLPLKMNGWKMKFPFGSWPIFMGSVGSVSFRQCNEVIDHVHLGFWEGLGFQL